MKKNRDGLLLIVVGPSGCGKGTVTRELIAHRADTFLSVSATTREPRFGEEEGVHYYYKTRDSFMQMVKDGQMLEYALYCNHYYGTPLAPIEKRCGAGENVILEIDMQGAKQVKERFPQAVLLFIKPPDMEELRRRLIGRGTEEMATIELRLATAQEEMKFAPECDYTIVNDTVENAVAQINEIIDLEYQKQPLINE